MWRRCQLLASTGLLVIAVAATVVVFACLAWGLLLALVVCSPLICMARVSERCSRRRYATGGRVRAWRFCATEYLRSYESMMSPTLFERLTLNKPINFPMPPRDVHTAAPPAVDRPTYKRLRFKPPWPDGWQDGQNGGSK